MEVALITIPVPPAPAGVSVLNHKGSNDLKFIEAAQHLEALFLSELLRPMEAEPSIGDFSDSDASQFASLRTNAIADSIAQAGGFGIAEIFFNAMVGRDGSRE